MTIQPNMLDIVGFLMAFMGNQSPLGAQSSMPPMPLGQNPNSGGAIPQPYQAPAGMAQGSAPGNPGQGPSMFGGFGGAPSAPMPGMMGMSPPMMQRGLF